MGKMKVKLPKPPREATVIQQEYGDVCRRYGFLKYQVYALTLEAETLEKTLVSLNQEFSARQKVDAEKAKEAPAEVPATEGAT